MFGFENGDLPGFAAPFYEPAFALNGGESMATLADNGIIDTASNHPVDATVEKEALAEKAAE